MGVRRLLFILIGLYSGQIFAANNIQLYGVADASIDYASGSESLFRVRDGGGAASRFGIEVKEDLGDGLYVNAVLETGFNINDGTEAFKNDTLFGRQAYVGFSGDWGEVRLGRQYAPHFYAFIKVDPFGLNAKMSPFSVLSSTASRGRSYLPYTSKFNNTIQYFSPKTEGVRFGAFVAPNEGYGGLKNKLNFGMGIGYENENLYLFYGYLGQRGGKDVQSSLFSTHFLGGSYRFGPVKLGAVAAFSNSSFAETRSARAYGLTFEWNVTSTDALKAAAAKRYVIGANDAPLLATLGWDHSLSKRTTAYARMSFVNNSPGGSSSINNIPIDPGSGDSGRSITIGMTHKF